MIERKKYALKYPVRKQASSLYFGLWWAVFYSGNEEEIYREKWTGWVWFWRQHRCKVDEASCFVQTLKRYLKGHFIMECGGFTPL